MRNLSQEPLFFVRRTMYVSIEVVVEDQGEVVVEVDVEVDVVEQGEEVDVEVDLEVDVEVDVEEVALLGDQRAQEPP